MGALWTNRALPLEVCKSEVPLSSVSRRLPETQVPSSPFGRAFISESSGAREMGERIFASCRERGKSLTANTDGSALSLSQALTLCALPRCSEKGVRRRRLRPSFAPRSFSSHSCKRERTWEGALYLSFCSLLRSFPEKKKVVESVFPSSP